MTHQWPSDSHTKHWPSLTPPAGHPSPAPHPLVMVNSASGSVVCVCPWVHMPSGGSNRASHPCSRFVHTLRSTEGHTGTCLLESSIDHVYIGAAALPLVLACCVQGCTLESHIPFWSMCSLLLYQIFMLVAPGQSHISDQNFRAESYSTRGLNLE